MFPAFEEVTRDWPPERGSAPPTQQVTAAPRDRIHYLGYPVGSTEFKYLRSTAEPGASGGPGPLVTPGISPYSPPLIDFLTHSANHAPPLSLDALNHRRGRSRKTGRTVHADHQPAHQESP